jgi:hypothetical protein
MRTIAISILFGIAASVAPPAPTYRGKVLGQWLSEMADDLDPEYRRTALEAVLHFGNAALPQLTSMLSARAEPQALTQITTALVRLSPAGRAAVASYLAHGPHERLVYVIDAIGQSEWAAAFVPYLRTLTSSPVTSMISLRVIAQTLSSAGNKASEEPSEGAWAGPGGEVFLKPLDCLVADRLSLVRAGVVPAQGATVSRVDLWFRTALQPTEFYVTGRPVGDPASARKDFDLGIPKPIFDAKTMTFPVTVVTYWVVADTTAGQVRTDEVTVAVSPTEEGCRLLGAYPLPAWPYPGRISVLSR